MEIVTYVIMPNHLHAIIHFRESGFDLNAIIANGKRFMAYEIIKRLKAADKTLWFCGWKTWFRYGNATRANYIKCSKIRLQKQYIAMIF